MGRVELPLTTHELSGQACWPSTSDFDFDQMVASGWQPQPFRLFLCKVHSRCNLDCDYCYVYKLADQSWRAKPRMMEQLVVDRLAERIHEHVDAHQIERVNLVLHGGEPLLCGLEYLRRFTKTMHAALPDTTDLVVLMQSNGTLVDERACEVLAELGIRLGISLDGEQRANDLHRPYQGGRPSYADVERSLRILDRYRNVFNGILSVIDVQSDPIATYRQLLTFDPPGIDFIFRLGDGSKPPPGKRDPLATPYADWLLPIFDEWYGSKPPRTQIRLFQEIMHLILGGSTGFESIGLNPVSLITIDTGGELEGVDTLKAVFDGAPALSMNVFDHSFDDALRHPSVIARQIGVDALHETCRACDVRDVCGGGYYPHRFREGTGFKNPSVYCADLMKIINYVAGRVRSDARALAATGRTPYAAVP